MNYVRPLDISMLFESGTEVFIADIAFNVTGKNIFAWLKTGVSIISVSFLNEYVSFNNELNLRVISLILPIWDVKLRLKRRKLLLK